MKCSCQAHGSWPPPWIRGCRAPHANEQRFVRRKEDVPWTMFHGFKSSRETVAATIRMAAPTKPTASASETTEIPMAASNGNSHSNINTILRTRPKTTALEHVSQWEASMGCKQMETKMQGKQAVGDSHFQVISPAQALLVLRPVHYSFSLMFPTKLQTIRTVGGECVLYVLSVYPRGCCGNFFTNHLLFQDFPCKCACPLIFWGDTPS